jgi:pimeloyl-ACP methyl ester carboxylesterase
LKNWEIKLNYNTIDIHWTEIFNPISGLKTDVFNLIRIDREVIPIIFVPGIMGSRLKNKSENKVWDPDDTGFMFKNYGKYNVTASMRKSLVIGKQFGSDYLQVSNDDIEHNKKFDDINDTCRAERGWGGIFWSSYGDLLIALQNHQWEEPEKHCFEFPVHAFGYNWTDDSFKTGKELEREIHEIIDGYKARKRHCKYVILVSHSMGGLVCRSACNLHGAEKKVLGVLHGVQPTTGAPAAYWRMKAGFERDHGGPSDNCWDWLKNPLKMTKHRLEGSAGAWVLGTDGEEVTCLLGNSPGGLQLLPSQRYTDNKGSFQWLHVPDRDGIIHSFPRNGNPYEEIYRIKDDVFWRLINPDWLEPMGTNPVGKSKIEGRNEIDTPWNKYLNCLNKAEVFHKKLDLKHHQNSRQFYSSGFDTVDKIIFEIDKNFIHLGINPEVEQKINTLITPSSKGRCIYFVRSNGVPAKTAREVDSMVRIVMPNEYNGGGDSTVPDSSAKALKLNKTVAIEIMARKDWFVQDHQNIYKSQKVKNHVFEAVRNFALKRIEHEIRPA